MARVDCRVCGVEIDAAAPSTTTIRGWGSLCEACEPRVDVVRNASGGFVRATVQPEKSEGERV